MKKIVVGALACWCFAVSFGFGQEVFYAQGKGDKKAIALTFDDGPGPWTERILAVLKEHNVKATFFMEGQQAQYRPKLVVAVRDGGHEIGNHTYSHKNFYAYKKDDKKEVLERELQQASQYIDKASGVTPHLLRMPYGYCKEWSREVASKQGYVMINWSFGCDWNKMTPTAVYEAYAKNIHAGAIFLMHDGGSNRKSTYEALPKLIDEIKRQGYELVTVSQLLGIKDDTVR
ncbi:MAG: polysaccharide deacetylase family protein [Endomicrobiales bacterium]|jgi:peptidoglycan/xylan/chitin deacetylase (PgdA/CDA1 family)